MATLLLIDDDRAVREMLNMLLSGSHECHTADRAEQALEFLEVQVYDLVITDISMPGLGGVEILRRIKQRHAATPGIVISGRMDEYKESLIDMGCLHASQSRSRWVSWRKQLPKRFCIGSNWLPKAACSRLRNLGCSN